MSVNPLVDLDSRRKKDILFSYFLHLYSSRGGDGNLVLFTFHIIYRNGPLTGDVPSGLKEIEVALPVAIVTPSELENYFPQGVMGLFHKYRLLDLLE